MKRFTLFVALVVMILLLEGCSKTSLSYSQEFNKSLELLQEGKDTKALSYLEDIAEKYELTNDTQDAYIELAILYYKKGDINGSIELLTNSLLLNPENYSRKYIARSWLALAYIKNKEMLKAREQIDQIEATDTNKSTFINSDEEYIINLVEEYISQKDYADAQTILNIIIKQNPEDILALQFVAKIQILTGQFDEAQKTFSNMISIEPNNCSLYLDFATFEKYRGNTNKYDEFRTKGLAMNPKCEMHLVFVGLNK